MFVSKYRIYLFICMIICFMLVGCSVQNTEEKQQGDVSEDSTHLSSEQSEKEKSNEASVDLEQENLLRQNTKIHSSEKDTSDIVSLTEQYIIDLENFIKHNKDLEGIKDNLGINIITESDYETQYIFNLVRYDANPIGFGTLERTWTFLQIINNDNIEVYSLFDMSAEYPLALKILEVEPKEFIISVAGGTNVSRNNTVFVNFWKYGLDGLTEYTDIIVESEYPNGELYENQYYVEFFNDDYVDITISEEQYGLFNIMGKESRIQFLVQEKTIEIKDF